MKFLYPLVVIALFIACSVEKESGLTYFVDSQSGSDNNTGTSAHQAWASLDKLNQMVFEPGTKILLKAGTEYDGQFEPKGSGEEYFPIIVDTFGLGHLPVIKGHGQKLYTVLLRNVQYWEVNNLDISNRGKERKAGRRGLMIHASNFGECNHLYLKGLIIHDVNGSLVKNEGGGSAVYFKNEGDNIPTRFNDLRIENCHLFNCERNGINSRGYTNRNNWFPNLGVVIRNNLLEGIPGDGIVPIGCDGAIVEHNVMRNCPDILSHEEAAAGIWPWSSDNTIIQFNEVYGHNAKWDGQGFDADWNCIGTLIQYNYSHDNAGGFLLVCNNGNNIRTPVNAGTLNTIIRYNVSINDGIRAYPTEREGFFSPIIHISGPCKNTRIYNNLIIIPKKNEKDIDPTLIEYGNWGGSYPESTLFANNIFMVEDQSLINVENGRETLFSHNCYFGNINKLPDDPYGIFSDPMLIDPGVRGSGFDILANFRLQKNSPCYHAGIKTADEVKDFFGQLVNANLDVSIGISQ